MLEDLENDVETSIDLLSKKNERSEENIKQHESNVDDIAKGMIGDLNTNNYNGALEIIYKYLNLYKD